MPRLTRYFVKSAFICLVLSFMTGIILHLDFLIPNAGVLRPVFYHLFLVGFTTQLIFGISYWMFPTISRDNLRGNESLGWISYVALNGGLLLRAMTEPAVALFPTPALRIALASAAFLQLIAVVAYVALIWKRTKAK